MKLKWWIYGKWCDAKRLVFKAYFLARYGKPEARSFALCDGMTVECAYIARGEMVGYWAYGHFDPAFPYQGQF